MKQWIASTLLMTCLVGCGGGGSSENGEIESPPPAVTPPPSDGSDNPPEDDANDPPTITGLSDLTLDENTSGTLSPTVDGSDDIDDYSWTQISGPELPLSHSDMAISFTVPEVEPEGDVIVLRFNVSSSNGTSAEKEVTVYVENVNILPVIQGFSTTDIALGEVVQFDASSSYDPDGEIVEWSWTVDAPSSSSATFSTPSQASTDFTPDVEGSYDVTIIVTDDLGGSREVVRSMQVTIPNTPPVADAGRDASILTTHTFQFDGSNSYDEELGELTYSWTLAIPENSTSTLNNPDNMFPSFTPDIPGTYTATLTVTDEEGLSDSDSVVITADNENLPPVAEPGTDITGKTGDVISMDGTGSYDPEGEELSYLWSLSSPDSSTASLDDSSSATPSFVPDIEGEYQLTLIVSDGTLDSEPQTVIATIEIGNSAPTANAGANQSGEILDTFTLDGSASSDPDGDMLTYQWTVTSQPEGAQANLSNATLEQATFSADVAGDYVVYLQVSDGEFTSTDVTTISLIHSQMKIWVIKNGERNGQTLGNGFHGTYTGPARAEERDGGTYELEITGSAVTVEVTSYDKNDVVDPYIRGLPDGTSTFEPGEVIRFTMVYPGSLEADQSLWYEIYIPEYDFTATWEATRTIP